ncbi:MAG: GntP family permease [Firmicutes bacterium]|nr:GntP family permease [Bacillota bacterium]
MLWGIIVGLGLLMFTCMKGASIIVASPVLSALVAATGRVDILKVYTDSYMTGAANYFKSWFPTFLLGALFGKIMDDTGAAAAVAHWIVKTIGKERAILAVAAATAVLTYGGISLFVVVFTTYPLALALFREANLPRRLIPGTIAFGAFTFTMTAIPGTPQIQNIIPTKYFGTTPTAAPIVGLICAAFIAGGGLWWMYRRASEARTKDEGYTPPEKESKAPTDPSQLPNAALSILPLVSVVVLLNVFKMDIIVSLAAGVLLALVLFFKRMANPLASLNQGATGSLLAIMNTSCAVGFGTVVRAVPGFADLVKVLSGVSLGNGLIYAFIAVNVLAGATGSASGGMSIALEALSKQLLATGANPNLLHRITSISSGGLDTLPHNGAVLTLLAVTGMTHKDSYIDVFMTSLLIPVLAGVLAIILGSIGLV